MDIIEDVHSTYVTWGCVLCEYAFCCMILLEISAHQILNAFNIYNTIFIFVYCYEKYQYMSDKKNKIIITEKGLIYFFA